MNLIKIDEIKKLSHANCNDMQDRIFPLHPLLDAKKEWNMWIPTPEGKLQKIMATPVESNYFSKEPEKKEDIRFEFLEFLHKRASWSDIYYWMNGANGDIYNLASSLAKIDILFEENKSNKTNISRMVATELEYIFITCRSLFDLLQKIIQKLWEKTNIAKQTLNPSFRKMVMKNESLISAEEIEKKYLIPKELAKIYHEHGPFFKWMREYRNRISHYGNDFNLIFIAEKGLAISIKEKPFSEMKIWTESNTLENNLGSLNSVAYYLIDSTLCAFDNIIHFFQSRSKFPSDLVPGYNMHTRGAHFNKLLNLDKKILFPW